MQLSVDDMQCNKACFILTQLHIEALPDKCYRIPSNLILIPIKFLNIPKQYILHFNPLFFPLHRHIHMITKRHNYVFTHSFINVNSGIVHDFLRQLQMLHGNRFQQLLQAAVHFFRPYSAALAGAEHLNIHRGVVTVGAGQTFRIQPHNCISKNTKSVIY